jgi:hypothetical protein
MKILFVGVFDTSRKSTNTSQLVSFKRLGHEVCGYNYRAKAAVAGKGERDRDLISVVSAGAFDLIIFSKCDCLSEGVFVESKKYAKTCLWFMDPITTYSENMKRKTGLVDYFCCDKESVLLVAQKINLNSFHVHEGFDGDVDKACVTPSEYDVSFIGNLYGPRALLLNQINVPVKVINGVYGKEHAKEVSKSRINLNFCTDNDASDRVYKILATKGFLLSNDWYGRDKYFINGEDCVIFKDVEDLNKKIEHYLQNPELRRRIAASGFKKVQQFNRINWAKKIIELYDEC